MISILCIWIFFHINTWNNRSLFCVEHVWGRKIEKEGKVRETISNFGLHCCPAAAFSCDGVRDWTGEATSPLPPTRQGVAETRTHPPSPTNVNISPLINPPFRIYWITRGLLQDDPTGRLYAMERGLKIPLKERTKATNAHLVSLMNQLEKISSPHFHSFSLFLLYFSDNSSLRRSSFSLTLIWSKF